MHSSAILYKEKKRLCVYVRRKETKEEREEERKRKRERGKIKQKRYFS